MKSQLALQAGRTWMGVGLILLLGVQGCSLPDYRPQISRHMTAVETQVTHGSGGRILTNTGVWSPDGEWIVYDTRSDAAGDRFDGNTIEMVNVRTGQVRELYRTRNGAHCGVATFHPRQWQVVFILGPEHPTAEWQYGPWHRRGVLAAADVQPGRKEGRWLLRNLDARDITPPFTPGALRGGTHVHVWDGGGEWVSFTYEDHVLAQFKAASAANEINQRNVGVSVPVRPVRVPGTHPRNHDGGYFTVLATQTTASPKPGSDEITRAFEEGWVGTNGYVRADGARQRHALAFQGQIVTAQGETIAEVFLVDLPDDPTVADGVPLQGTATRRPFPPKGTHQRRLTHTAERRYPGLQGPRHWLRSAPDGSRIAFLMKDDRGVVQFWTVSPNGGAPAQLTRNPWSIASAFTWSPNGRFLAHVMDRSVCVTDTATGETTRLTPRSGEAEVPRPEACVFSPDGREVAFVRHRVEGGRGANQICVLTLK